MSALIAYASQILAVAACVVGAAMGGYALARPDETLGQMGLKSEGASGLGEARAFGGLLVLAHGGVAATLGYAPYIGAVMACALALMWLGAAGGRGLSLFLDRDSHAQAVHARGLLILDLLMAGGLMAPIWILYGGGGGQIA